MRRPAACVLALLAVAAAPIAAEARVKKVGPVAKPRRVYGGYAGYGGYNRHPNRFGNSINHGQAVAALHEAHGLLTQAQHDYDGHRVRALHEVNAALNHIQPGSGRPIPAQAKGGPSIPQATSDQHLRSAYQGLSEVAGHLAAHGTTTRHRQAHAAILKAGQEIQTALNVR